MGPPSTVDNPIGPLDRILRPLGFLYYFLGLTLFVPISLLSTMLFVSPLMYINMEWFTKIESYICRMVNAYWVSASWYLGIQITEYGDDITSLSEKKCLFLSNHLGIIDNMVVMNALHNKGTVPGRWIWVIFNIWRSTPMGLMWAVHGNFFVDGGPARKLALLQEFKQHLKDYFHKFNFGWIVIYPEGSRLFLVKESGRKFAAKLGLAPLDNCVYPRTGAVHAVMEVLAPAKDDNTVCQSGDGAPIEYVIDATLGYPKEVPSVDKMVYNSAHYGAISVHYSVHKVDPEWSDEEKLKDFLNDQYSKKDKLLADFYASDGAGFPGKKRANHLGSGTIYGSQIFWFGLLFLHYRYWIGPIFSLFFSFIGF